ncbi:hypothetical protein [Schleiferia thermophila]|jgi:hypothetical protein|uniref:hypothetical protein n=1 Tax=Schleiferia thermophila TaxID=884107 RepID=UPI00126829E3|nr:hypothetical protein [Schleiferia thermophila]
MKKNILPCVFLSFMLHGMAQSNNSFYLTAGSEDGMRWKFLWTMRTNIPGLNAFVLKRKKISERRWNIVTSPPIEFALSPQKDYSNLNLAPDDLSGFNQKINELFESGRLKAVSNEVLLNELNNAEKLQQFQFVTALDYDLARAAGLGCDDIGLESDVVYEYGLFLVVNGREQNKPVATIRITAGEKFSFKDITDFQVLPFTGKSSVQLKWKANSEKVRQLAQRGFNVYRKDGEKWKQLNKAPVISTDSKGFYSILDSGASSNSVNEYSIRLLSIFNFEGEDNLFFYDPDEYIENYKIPEIQKIDGSRPYSDGILIGFNIDESMKRHLKQLEIQRADGDVFNTIGTLGVLDTLFIDRQPLTPKQYYAYRVKASCKDGTILHSDVALIYYMPKILPPPPKNLRASVRNQNKRTFITLEWDKGSPDDTITTEYYIYASHPLTNKIQWVNFEESITQTRFVYEVQTDFSATYRFCVSALGKYMYESETSDTIEVKISSRYLPIPIVTGWEVDSSSALFRWDYPMIDDLKGFRIYRDGMLIISERDLPAESRAFNTGPMRFFSRYVFEIEAVSTDGFVSMRSVPIEIVTDKQKKKPASNQ